MTRVLVALALAVLAAVVEPHALAAGRRIPRRVARALLALAVAATVALVAASMIFGRANRPP